MTTPTTTQSPKEIFTGIANDLARIRTMLLDLRAEEKIPLSQSLMLLQHNLELALKRANECAVASLVPEKTMSAGGQDQ